MFGKGATFTSAARVAASVAAKRPQDAGAIKELVHIVYGVSKVRCHLLGSGRYACHVKVSCDMTPVLFSGLLKLLECAVYVNSRHRVAPLSC